MAGAGPTEWPEPPPAPPPPVRVEVFAPILLASGLTLMREGSAIDLVGVGRTVHRDEVRRYPPAMREEYRRLWALLHAIQQRFGRSVVIRIVAPPSLHWFMASLRHRIRRYPTFLLDGRERITGWEEHLLVERIQQRLRAKRSGTGDKT
ncbi:MAG: hypothetical protein QN141_10495 [Armatimonadota bacterium]|nr:hypothetical protein [Armatimonadota bacterium]MDR7494365.1 hypothetical protein [Armatimonadota bacterium]MDR7499182.1 hypothetical protein [Armatimonadota bacterium]MDR7558905.1 hypothetical protein [Armatimonadota bacterium]